MPTLHPNFRVFEGDLFKQDEFHVPLRPKFAWHFREITEGKQLVACLRAGDCTDYGCYSIGYITSDGGLLCPDCVRKELFNVIDSIRHGLSDGWQVVACEAECNVDGCERCSHCNAMVFGSEDDEKEELTEEDVVTMLNELGVPELDRKSNGGNIPDGANYGEWMRRHDRVAFNVTVQEYRNR